MSPFEVSPGWYDAFWCHDRRRPKHQTVSRNVARVAVLIVLLLGGGLVVTNLQVHGDVSGGMQDWEQE